MTAKKIAVEDLKVGSWAVAYRTGQEVPAHALETEAAKTFDWASKVANLGSKAADAAQADGTTTPDVGANSNDAAPSKAAGK